MGSSKPLSAATPLAEHAVDEHRIVIHRAAPSFWSAHDSLPSPVRDAAQRTFALMKSDPQHPYELG